MGYVPWLTFLDVTSLVFDQSWFWISDNREPSGSLPVTGFCCDASILYAIFSANRSNFHNIWYKKTSALHSGALASDIVCISLGENSLDSMRNCSFSSFNFTALHREPLYKHHLQFRFNCFAAVRSTLSSTFFSKFPLWKANVAIPRIIDFFIPQGIIHSTGLGFIY